MNFSSYLITFACAALLACTTNAAPGLRSGACMTASECNEDGKKDFVCWRVAEDPENTKIGRCTLDAVGGCAEATCPNASLMQRCWKNLQKYCDGCVATEACVTACPSWVSLSDCPTLTWK